MTAALDDLLDWAARTTRKRREYIEREVNTPDWEDEGWPSCVPDDVAELWEDISIDARIIAFAFASCTFRDSDAVDHLL
jgi:hypothetical protein